MPYYITPQQTTRRGIEPVLPPGIVNWAGGVMEDGRYLFFARAMVDLTLLPLISIVTRAQAAALTERVSEDDLSLWGTA